MDDRIHLRITDRERIGGIPFFLGISLHGEVLLLLKCIELRRVLRKNWRNGIPSLSSSLSVMVYTTNRAVFGIVLFVLRAEECNY